MKTFWSVFLLSIAITVNSPACMAQSKQSLKELEERAKQKVIADKAKRESLEKEEKAAQGRNLVAQGKIAIQDKRYDDALKRFSQGAELGSVEALFYLGETYYYYRKQVDNHQIEGIKFWKMAADRGYGLAQYKLANEYWYGANIEKNKSEALRLYQSAANAGVDAAQIMISIDLLYGRFFDRINATEAKARLVKIHSAMRGKLANSDVAIFYGLGGDSSYHWTGEDSENLLWVTYSLGELSYAGEEFGLESDIEGAEKYWNQISKLTFVGGNETVDLANHGLACIKNRKISTACAALRQSIGK